jgi:putative transcriptional regulator
MNKKYNSPLMASVHETVEGFHGIGLIDKKTMREFDLLCLTPVEPLSAEEIRQLRIRENVSQEVLAHYLNVTKGLISQWERGIKKPSGSSLKLLSLVEKNGLSMIA